MAESNHRHDEDYIPAARAVHHAKTESQQHV